VSLKATNQLTDLSLYKRRSRWRADPGADGAGGRKTGRNGADLVLDAVFGTGLNRAPEGRFAEWIEAINASGLRVVAVDVPSGLDSDTGVAYSPCVRADVTVTFTLPKAGLLTGDGPRVCGDISVADIGIPDEALAAIGLKAVS